MKMKRWSIKARVTFWYVFFLISLTVLMLSALLYNSDHLTQKNIRGDLVALVESSARDVKVENNRLKVDDDIISYRDGVSILVYGENNFIITGNLPEYAPEEIPFVPEKVRKVRGENHSVYVYDFLIDGLPGTDVWVRGVTDADRSETFPGILSAIRLFIILLPALIVLASVGGYFLTRRAFRPVAQITETVDRIQAGGDLSRRIGFPYESRSRDEIYGLSATFDRMLDRLESSFLSEKQFSDDASHELRTPISVIISQCEYGLKDTASPEEVKNALEVSLHQAQKMSGLVSQLLTLARADRGANKLVPEKIDLSELLDIVCMEQEAAAEEKQIALLREIEPEIYSLVDQTMIMRLMINLISNSIQYGRPGGTSRISLYRKNGSAVLQVADDGIGIAEEDLPKIWDRFFQANPSRTTDSLGLGLSMVKWIAEAHGGAVTAESRIDKGTVFTLTLPIREEEQK